MTLFITLFYSPPRPSLSHRANHAFITTGSPTMSYLPSHAGGIITKAELDGEGAERVIIDGMSSASCGCEPCILAFVKDELRYNEA